MRSPIHHKPQTSRQAKAAYAKRKGTKTLTDVELRQLAREHELEARAQRLREREKTKKANAKKRAEKEAKENETRRRMGIVVQESYLSPGQVRIEDFLNGKKGIDHTGPKQKEDGLEHRIEGPEELTREGNDMDNGLDRKHLGDLSSNRLSQTCPIPIPVNSATKPFAGEEDSADLSTTSKQVKRELRPATEITKPSEEVVVEDTIPYLIPWVSTQELELSVEDLDELQTPAKGFSMQEDVQRRESSKTQTRPIPVPGGGEPSSRSLDEHRALSTPEMDTLPTPQTVRHEEAALDTSLDTLKRVESASTSFYGESITASQEDALYRTSPSAKPQVVPPAGATPAGELQATSPTATDYFTFGDCGFSTQELLEMPI